MLERFFSFFNGISSIYRIVQKIEREEMEGYGLKGGYALYLATLIQYPDGLTSAQLCDICDRDKAAVSRTISELEARGMVYRADTDTSYRAKILLTDAGREAAQYVCRKIAAAVELASQGLTEEDRAVFYAILTRFSENLQEISRDGLLADLDN